MSVTRGKGNRTRNSVFAGRRIGAGLHGPDIAVGILELPRCRDRGDTAKGGPGADKAKGIILLQTRARQQCAIRLSIERVYRTCRSHHGNLAVVLPKVAELQFECEVETPIGEAEQFLARINRCPAILPAVENPAESQG